MNTLPAIFECGILTTKNVSNLQEVNEELANAWNKRQVHRTEVEMRISVLNDGKHPTLASKYWQAVREQTVMLDNLAVVGFEYRRNDVKLRRLQKQLTDSIDTLDAEEIQIDIDECYFKSAAMQQGANDRVREIMLWSAFKKEFDDGSFDTDDVNAHQAESLHITLLNRRACLSESSSQAEVINVLGPLMTSERLRA